MNPRLSLALLIGIITSCKTTSGHNDGASSGLKSTPQGQEIGDVSQVPPVVLDDNALIDRHTEGREAKKLIRLLKRAGVPAPFFGESTLYRVASMVCEYQADILNLPPQGQPIRLLYTCTYEVPGAQASVTVKGAKARNLHSYIDSLYPEEAEPLPGQPVPIEGDTRRILKNVTCETGTTNGTNVPLNKCDFSVNPS